MVGGRHLLLAEHQRVPGATTIYLNLRQGLLTMHQVLEPLRPAVPVEAADVMTPGDGTEPDVFAVYRELFAALATVLRH
jgi:hypothetical protein